MTVVPMYMNEISPQKLAGSMGTLFCIGLCIGVFVSQLLGLDSLLGEQSTLKLRSSSLRFLTHFVSLATGTPTLWPYLVGGSFVCCVFVFIALPFLPESPKFLHSVRGEHEKALEGMR